MSKNGTERIVYGLAGAGLLATGYLIGSAGGANLFPDQAAVAQVGALPGGMSDEIFAVPFHETTAMMVGRKIDGEWRTWIVTTTGTIVEMQIGP
ncbi:MAG: hypothetical protein ACF8PN_12175 [Phycisphaerales bacterium]